VTAAGRKGVRLHPTTVVLAVMLASGAGTKARERQAAGGEAVFRARCARCHGETGRSDTPYGRSLKVAPLRSDPRLATMKAADIAKRVRSDAKHRAVVELDEGDLDAAATFVRKLAAEP